MGRNKEKSNIAIAVGIFNILVPEIISYWGAPITFLPILEQRKFYRIGIYRQ